MLMSTVTPATCSNIFTKCNNWSDNAASSSSLVGYEKGIMRDDKIKFSSKKISNYIITGRTISRGNVSKMI